MKKKLGLYIHIPFCLKKCSYCGFLSFAGKEQMMDQYVEALIKEMEHYKGRLEDQFQVDSVFLGGGTPTLLKASHVERLLEEVSDWLTLGCEITMEGNPKTFDEEKLTAFRKAGVNRLSIGCQSLDDQVLKNIGRVHTRQDFLDSFKMARTAGFDNINMDLMFALPGQSMEVWEENLREAIELEPEHISFYSLQIEEGTPFYNQYKEDKLKVPSDEEERRMHHRAMDILKKAGYLHYEISNCGKAGKECRHNLKYWNMDDYLGLGLGASSFVDQVRFKNTEDLDKYIYANGEVSIEGSCHRLYCSIDEYEVEGAGDLAGEMVFTGLRKRDGFRKDRFKEITGADYDDFYADILDERKKNIRLGYLVETDERVYITEEGIDHSNDIMSDFV